MNHLLTIDPSVIDWSRAQFALTAIYHWLFVPLTLGLAVVMGIIETIYYRTGKPFWREAARFWQRLFGVNFAMGGSFHGMAPVLKKHGPPKWRRRALTYYACI